MRVPDAAMSVDSPAAASRSRYAPTLPACRVAVLTSDLEAAWDRSVASHGSATLLHSLAWRNAVVEAFGHEPIYLVALRGPHIVGMLPMFLVSSRLAGRMLVSVPYGVGGGIIADEGDVAALLFATARQTASERNCAAIELRSERACVPGLPVIDRHVGFRRALPGSSSDVLGWLPRKARAAARNARTKYKLTVEFGDEQPLI